MSYIKKTTCMLNTHEHIYAYTRMSHHLHIISKYRSSYFIYIIQIYTFIRIYGHNDETYGYMYMCVCVYIYIEIYLHRHSLMNVLQYFTIEYLSRVRKLD